jgi:hypothetical protein
MSFDYTHAGNTIAMQLSILERQWLLIPEILFLVKQVRPRRTQIDDLRTSVSILL